jgi:hypothetical protein
VQSLAGSVHAGARMWTAPWLQELSWMSERAAAQDRTPKWFLQ